MSGQFSRFELRKAVCEALGFKLYSYEEGRYAESDADYEDAARNDGWTWEGWDSNREAWECQIESDSGVFWPEFLKWTRANHIEWSLNQVHGDFGYIGMLVYGEWASGSTPTEAGCRAWLKALAVLAAEGR